MCLANSWMKKGDSLRAEGLAGRAKQSMSWAHLIGIHMFSMLQVKRTIRKYLRQNSTMTKADQTEIIACFYALQFGKGPVEGPLLSYIVVNMLHKQHPFTSGHSLTLHNMHLFVYDRRDITIRRKDGYSTKAPNYSCRERNFSS